jgi:hypothetical protein
VPGLFKSVSIITLWSNAFLMLPCSCWVSENIVLFVLGKNWWLKSNLGSLLYSNSERKKYPTNVLLIQPHRWKHTRGYHSAVKFADL